MLVWEINGIHWICYAQCTLAIAIWKSLGRRFTSARLLKLNTIAHTHMYICLWFNQKFNLAFEFEFELELIAVAIHSFIILGSYFDRKPFSTSFRFKMKIGLWTTHAQWIPTDFSLNRIESRDFSCFVYFSGEFPKYFNGIILSD